MKVPEDLELSAIPNDFSDQSARFEKVKRGLLVYEFYGILGNTFTLQARCSDLFGGTLGDLAPLGSHTTQSR